MIWSYETRSMDERQLLDKIPCANPIIVTDMHRRIVGVNREWITMCKYTSEEAFGRTPGILQGPLTNRETALDFSIQLCAGHPSFASLINYKKDGSLFMNHLYGWYLGDLLVAETYAEHAIQANDDDEMN